MATSLNNNAFSNVGITPVNIIHTDGTKNITLLGLNICNKTVSPVSVDGYITAGSNTYYVFKNLQVDAETTVVAIGDNQRLIIDAYQDFYITSSANSSIDVIASVAATYLF